jgi:hypothetical protein
MKKRIRAGGHAGSAAAAIGHVISFIKNPPVNRRRHAQKLAERRPAGNRAGHRRAPASVATPGSGAHRPPGWLSQRIAPRLVVDIVTVSVTPCFWISFAGRRER